MWGNVSRYCVPSLTTHNARNRGYAQRHAVDTRRLFGLGEAGPGSMSVQGRDQVDPGEGEGVTRRDAEQQRRDDANVNAISNGSKSRSLWSSA
jgi:hypothetical protein